MSIESEVHRPLADYSANIWEDILTHFSKSELETIDTLKEKHSTLKEAVTESFMASKENPIENIKFIDALCRLGISYHFEIDIIEQLGYAFNSLDFNQLIRHDECDLYTVGLLFQVFRQFGFKLSADVFEKFKGEDGKFKEHLVADASVEHSWRRYHRPSSRFFKLSLKRNFISIYPQHLAVRIKNALKHPYHKGISRIETRKYISYYEAEEKRDAVLLEFAKIDFNMLQMLHRTELACVTRWYEAMEIKSKVTYTRHRVAEAYLWSIGAYFEPQYSQARVKTAIALIIFTMLDDTYDAYGTMEELEIFTDAIEKWLPAPPNMIPESMKYVYRIMVDFYEKLEEEFVNEGRSGCGFHLKKALKTMANGYMQEAKWLKEKYTATFDEYMENALVTSGYYSVSAMTFSRMGNVANLDAFEWLSSNPKIRVASEKIGRFTDDISTYEFERKREHVATAIDCYMKQFGVSKEQAVEGINIMLSDAWKDMNQELMRPHSCPFPLLMRIFNLSRVIDVFYRYQDCYTHPEFLKEHIVSLFIEDIPI
ncbi:hypothetical protein HID58_077394 [Brassica napus]|uniref:(+)-delta-cadinene synthase n=1 Tax=Brassica napus TaxID=3708 RepID=A0ABQ7YRX9_BRANA|nr:hypothetical protein HID58_077394 [Brassica napus]